MHPRHSKCMHGNMMCLDTCMVPKWNNMVLKVWPYDNNIIEGGFSLSKGENIYLFDFNSMGDTLIIFLKKFNERNNEI
jgi:hypothetical protein